MVRQSPLCFSQIVIASKLSSPTSHAARNTNGDVAASPDRLLRKMAIPSADLSLY